MIDRIFKSWKSTALGFAIMAGAFALVWAQKVTIIEASPALLGLLGFLWKEKK